MKEPKVPFFSVVMPVYNAEAYVACAVDSVLAQTDSDWELIAIDDFSSDRTPEILAGYAKREARVRVFRNERNLKAAASLNRGIARARGTWIVHLDADDFFNPDYLEALRPAAEKASWDCFISCWPAVVDESGQKLLDVYLPGAETIHRMMKLENFLYHTATSFTKRLWKEVCGYPEENPFIAEDMGLWNKFFVAKAKLQMIPRFLVNYRIHYSNVTSLNDAQLGKQADAKEWKTFRQNREWRISLYLKQKKLDLARMEILTLGRMQKYLSLKNIQYFFLTFLPESFVHFFMWEFRPRMRAFFKSLRGKSLRV